MKHKNSYNCIAELNQLDQDKVFHSQKRKIGKYDRCYSNFAHNTARDDKMYHIGEISSLDLTKVAVGETGEKK